MKALEYTYIFKFCDFLSSPACMQVYADHAFIGSEAANHGLQVFDLTQLRDIEPSTTGSISILQETAYYDQFGSSHNIVINEDTGYLYAVGSYTCTSGLHIINIQDPTDPQYEACYADDGYVHDAQCVVYKGPDADYQGREICFCYNENALTIVDVEDKNNIKMISKVLYDNLFYTHQVLKLSQYCMVFELLTIYIWSLT